ncbi:MAG: toll/interleukin-1 receptor domain-containing protein [Hyphomonadaceae bacterium]|nr:toll/interleukin-1 receptor domain-containing protein [Hyphomonadaceae bacterium]
MADIFLSYARADAQAALQIKTALEALGLTVFFDTVNLDAGDEFPTVLEDEIAGAGVVVTCWTTHALTRDWVLTECKLARVQGKLVPVEIGEISDDVISVAYSKIDRCDLKAFQGNASHPEWQKLVRTLERRLGKSDLLKLAAKRAEEERKAREKERERLARLEQQHAELKKRKGGLRAWHWAVGALITLAVGAGASYWVWQQQSEQIRNRLIPAEIRAQLDDPETWSRHSREAVEAILAREDIDLSQLIQAASIDSDAAFLAGSAFFNGVGGVTQDHTAAARLYLAACEGGNMRGCHNLGGQYQNGEGVAQDWAEAVRLSRRACEGEYMPGCHNLGFLYEKGQGVEQDWAEAVRLFRLACEGGVMGGCTNLGIRYANGEGVAQDQAEAVRLYRLACEGGDMNGCNNLGVLYANGEGIAQDQAEAVRLYRLACEGGVMGGCNNLGVQYARGEGVAQDWAEAVRLYRLACEGEDMGGCNNLGLRYANGEGVAQDQAEAVRLYRLACEGGVVQACGNGFLASRGLSQSSPPPP